MGQYLFHPEFFVYCGAAGGAPGGGRRIANTTAGAVAAACASPSPIAGTGYSYTFTYAYNTGCAGASSVSAPSYGTVTMTISTPAATVAAFNYKSLIGGTLSASATMPQEYVCPAAASSSSVTQTMLAARPQSKGGRDANEA